MRDLFKLKKGNAAIKLRVIRDILTFSDQEEDYYKSAVFGTTILMNTRIIVMEKISTKEYLDVVKPYSEIS